MVTFPNIDSTSSVPIAQTGQNRTNNIKVMRTTARTSARCNKIYTLLFKSLGFVMFLKLSKAKNSNIVK